VKAPQISPISYNRRQRRSMLKQQGVLKYLGKLNFLGEVRSKFRAQNIENGRKLHQQNLDAQDKTTAVFLEAKLESMKETWTEQGYNSKEIVMLEEAWSLTVIKDKETYRADKKRARALSKEANSSLLARKNK